MSAVAAYRLAPDEMTTAAASIGCGLAWPHIGRDFKWACPPDVVLVTNNATETAWCQVLLWRCTGLCLIRGRLQWKSTLQGQIALYFGTDPAAFKAAFSGFGPAFGWAP